MKVIGHRGFKSEYPENTLYGFQQAFESGILSVELDVHLSKDDQVVVAHDPNVSKRLFSHSSSEKPFATVPIVELTYAELLQFECGRKRESNSGYPRNLQIDTRVPLLADVLAAGDDKPVNWHVEIKYGPKYYPAIEKIVEKVMEQLHEANVTEQTMVFSYSQEILQRVKKHNSKQKINYLYRGRNLLGRFGKSYGIHWNIPNWAECDKVVEELQADAFSPNYRLLEVFSGWRNYFAREKRNCQLLTWTCNDEKSWQRFLREGELDGIITDEPVKLQNLLDSWL